MRSSLNYQRERRIKLHFDSNWTYPHGYRPTRCLTPPIMASSDAQRIERALQLLDARLAKSDLFNDGTVKVVPATSNVGESPSPSSWKLC